LDITTNTDPKVASVNIIQTLIALPDFLRKSILQGKLKEFYSMEKQDKYETISVVLETLPSINEDRLSTLTRTWMEVLSDLDSEQIVEILRIYCEEFKSDPEVIQKIHIDSIIHIFYTLEDKKKEKLIDCLKEVFLSFPNRYEIINLIPDSGQRALRIK
jgi:hypothetical protein